VIAEYQSDDRAQKVDLGVGVYRDADGNTPILPSVKKAEQYLVDNQETKAYMGSSGSADFNREIQRVTFGDEIGASDRITTLQCPGGSGSLRVAGEIARRANGDVSIWAGSPTWANHIPLLGSAGVSMQSYPYYNAETKSIDFDALMDALGNIPSGDIVLFHGCCHNPSGMDLDEDQWRAAAEVVASRGLMPFIDIAYQGLARGLQLDNFGVRHMFENVPEMLVASSCSKNFALYRDRVGSLSIVSKDHETADIVRMQANSIVRTMYSMPPDHGAAVVTRILSDADLRAEWEVELDGMRDRLNAMRSLLGTAMKKHAPDHDFSHFERGRGMFAFAGVSPEQVERLKEEFAVYMVGSSRINIAGITQGNVDQVATAIAAVL
jgi:aspartate aminotransferase